MATEKTAYNPVDGGPPAPSLPGQPAFPVAFDANAPGPNMFGSPGPNMFGSPSPVGIPGPGGFPAPGGFPGPAGLPFPPPTAFAPGVPGAYGMPVNPQGGQGYAPNPACPPYSPPGPGFHGNISS